MRRRPRLLALLAAGAVLVPALPAAASARAAGVPGAPAVSTSSTPTPAPPGAVSPAAGAAVTGPVSLSWSPVAGASAYQVLLTTSARSTAGVTLRVAASRTTALLDTGTWYWRVRAVEGALTGYAAPRAVRVTAPTRPRAAAPSGLRPGSGATVRTADPVFGWRPLTGRSGYELRLSRTARMTTPTTLPAGATGRAARLDAGSWYWQVRAAGDGRSLAGRWSTPRRLVVAPAVDVYAPTRPGALSVQSVGQTSATVSYGRARDDSTTALTYEVLANGRVAVTTRSTSGVTVPLPCGKTYTLAVRAVDARGNRSALSPPGSVRTRACLDVTPPAVPTGLRVVSATEHSITVTWTAAADPGHGPVPQYLLTRSGVPVGGATTTTYTFSRLEAATTYVLGVRSRDRVGNESTARAELTATTASPAQATGDVRAYVLATDDRSFADARAHYRSLRQVYPTFFQVDGSGGVTGTGQAAMTRWFTARGVGVLPRFHTEDPGVIEAVAADPHKRDRLVNDVVRIVAAGGYSGANIDFEMSMPSTGIGTLTKKERWDRLRDGFATFNEELGARLHAQGSSLSIAVAVNWCHRVVPSTREVTYCASSTDTSALNRPRPYLYDYRRLAQASDELWLLAWGLHWSTSVPGPLADSRWLEGVDLYFRDLFADAPALRAKITLGTQLYGFDWSYRVHSQTSVPMPGGVVPAAPACAEGSRVLARPRFDYLGTPESGTLTVDWLCNTRPATPLEYDGVTALQQHSGSVRQWDAPSGESWFTVEDGTPGVFREVWLADAPTIDRRLQVARNAGWRVGLWRLGREDQQIWTLPGMDGEAL